MLLKRNKLKISEKLTTPFRSSLSPLQTPSSEGGGGGGGGIEILIPMSDSDENREIQMKKCKKVRMLDLFWTTVLLRRQILYR